ncbi:hypothetical protein QA648_27360 (plasmid) [Rhizobium sp. CB3171]|uniref:hypothetical protein n=1 Tax=Rhizobium sp. CB3171 TaxID=3039157 RepID=UPI0024B09291|nr:hypothetical protein [Rhizobium sp. CB3171]WFU04503.1 hypothetical protein QA648_27360 [Rhizobium sp. CB3171]
MKSQPKRRPRIGRSGEHSFGQLCADAGVLCQDVTEDESGWDHLVEFPTRESNGPADAQEVARHAYVQTKATGGRTAKTQIILSNALKAAQHKSPWFVVLFHAPANGLRRIYAIHIWKALMTESLRSVRQAESIGRPLNHSKMTMTFCMADDHTNDLLEWMEETVAAIGDDYSAQKVRLYKSLGFEHGTGTGTITFSEHTEEEIVRAFLGLDNGLKVDALSFTPSRFGIPASQPLITTSRGTVQFEPIAQEIVELRFRDSNGSPPVIMSAEVYSSGLARYAECLGRLRFAAPFFDILWSPQTGMQFTAKIDPEKAAPISEIENYAICRTWMAKGDLDVQIWARGSKILAGAFEEKIENPRYWEKLAKICGELTRISNSNFQVALQEVLGRKSDIEVFCDTIKCESLTCAFGQLEGVTPLIEEVIYYATVSLASFVFYSLVKRPVISITTADDQLTVVLGSPVELDCHMVRTHDVDTRQWEADYDRAMDKSVGIAMGFGNITDCLGRTTEKQFKLNRVS